MTTIATIHAETTAQEDTMTDTTITTTIPFSIVNNPEHPITTVTMIEDNCLVLRRNPFGLIPQDYHMAKAKADTLGWFVRTAHDMQAAMEDVRVDATSVERGRLRDILIPRLRGEGLDTEYINLMLVALGMETLTRTFRVKVTWSQGYGYYARTIMDFTFETDDMDIDEESVREHILEEISFDESEIEVDIFTSLSMRIGGTDISESGYSTVTVDTSDYYDQFDCEVTEVL